MTQEKTKDHWIGFDLGGTKMLAVVYDSDFKQLGKSRKKTKGHEGQSNGLKRINSTIREALEDAKVDASQIKGLGIGCPGPLDIEKKTIRMAPNLGWKNVKVGQSIENEFGFPVTVANDVDAGVFGEYSFGAGKGKRCVVGIFPGTGVGGGCVYEGKLIRGSNCTCMEIGHIPPATVDRWKDSRRDCRSPVAQRWRPTVATRPTYWTMKVPTFQISAVVPSATQSPRVTKRSSDWCWTPAIIWPWESSRWCTSWLPT